MPLGQYLERVLKSVEDLAEQTRPDFDREEPASLLHRVAETDPACAFVYLGLGLIAHHPEHFRLQALTRLAAGQYVDHLILHQLLLAGIGQPEAHNVLLDGSDGRHGYFGPLRSRGHASIARGLRVGSAARGGRPGRDGLGEVGIGSHATALMRSASVSRSSGRRSMHRR